MMTVAVLCGGKGTRLAPLTDDLPKYLVDVCGQPFAQRQMALLKRNGYEDVVLLVGHLGDRIRAVVGDGSAWGMRVRYSDDGYVPLGADGAIKKALPMLGEAFFVLYGDSYLDCDYQEIEQVFRDSGEDALLTTYKSVDYGLRAFRRYPAQMIRTSYHPMPCRWMEVGSHEGLAEVRKLFESRSGLHFQKASLQPPLFARQYLDETREILGRLDHDAIERMASALAALRNRGGRLFVLGNGGSAANASHAVNDFRKIAGIEAYAPMDNVAELTARTNDDGWETTFAAWLRVSRLEPFDAVLVLSVGGGSAPVSQNIFRAVSYARDKGTPVLGIVGRDGGRTAEVASACVLIPTVDEERVTPHAEEMQSVVLHLLVSHPLLKRSV